MRSLKKTKQGRATLVSIAKGAFFAFTLLLLVWVNSAFASTVGTTTSLWATMEDFQRKSFYANGRFWVFYSDGTDMVYKTSTDGSTWGSATIVRASVHGNRFSIWFDGTYLHYAWASSTDTNVALYYRRGVPNSNGTITWSAAEQIAGSAFTSWVYKYPFVSVDSGGYPWIGFRRQEGAGPSYYPYVTKSSTSDGTWSTATGFPYQLDTVSNDYSYVSPIPLTNNKVYVLYARYNAQVIGKLWDGAAWGSNEFATTSNIRYGYMHSAVANGDDVHLVFLNFSPYDIVYRKRTYGTGWGSQVTVQAAGADTSAPALSIDRVNGDLYCFWAGSPTANHIYYKKNSGGTWDASPTDWINETTDSLTGNDRITSFYRDYSGKIGLVYMAKTSSPYDVRFGLLQSASQLSTKAGTFTAIAGTGNQSVTGIGFKPKALLFWITDRTSAGAGPPARFGQGWTDGTNQGAMATAWSDNVASTRISGRASNTKSILLIDDNGDSATVLAAATIVSFDNDGFTINWNPAGGSRIVAYLALGGDAITNVKAGSVQRTMTGPGSQYSITGVGFQPDVVLLLGKETWVAWDTSEGNRAQGSFGIGISSTNRHTTGYRQRCQVGGDTNCTNNNYGSSGHTTQYASAPADDDESTPELAIDMVSMDSDGFTLIDDIASNDGRRTDLIYLALKGVQVARGVITQPTTTGNQSVTGLSFQPSVVLFDGGDKATVDGFEQDAEYVTGAATGSESRFAIWIGNGDPTGGISISDTDLSTTRVIRSLTAGTPALNADADFVSMNSDGFTINWTSVDLIQRKIGWIALGHGRFEYRREVTIQSSQIGSSCTSNLSNFPVLVSLSNQPWLRTKANGGNIYDSNGWDIIFRASDGVTQLDHEIETYDGTNGTLVAWVRIPTLSYNQNTTIYIYYGNPAITSSTDNKTGVWSNNFREVWHLHETSGNHIDSRNNYIGTVQGTVNRGAAGQIDGADDFVGPTTTSWISLADSSWTLGGTSPFTLEAWFRAETLNNNWPGIITRARETDNDWVGLWVNDFNQITFGWDWQSGKGGNLDGSVLTAGQWYHAVGTFDGTNRTLYLNGALNAGPSAGWHNDIAVSSRIGNDGSNVDYFDGIIDEVRISEVARDLCWIQTSYNNQKNPGTFITLEPETAPAPTSVKLTSFTATEYSDGVLLKWKTGYEVDNLGFHVYREENGQRVRLTPEPVAGSALMAGSRTALTAGHHYHWWDTSSLSAINYQPSAIKYWLKDIDLNGTETMHGPVTPVFSRDPIPEKFKPELLSEIGWRLNERYQQYWKARELKEKLALKRLEVRGAPRGRGLRSTPAYAKSASAGRPFEVKASNLKARRAGPPTSRPEADLLRQQFLAGRPAVKLFVREEGWYRVSQPELVAAGLSSNVNPNYLQLYVDGREIPVRVIGKRANFDAIEFYGTGLDTPSTDTRVYWLVEGTQPGKRITPSHTLPPRGGGIGWGGRIPSTSFPYSVEKKDRTIYFAALKNGDEENFFGPVVYMNQVNQILELRHLDRTTSEDALLEVVLQGATDTPHRVRVLLNEAEVGEIVFAGQGKGTLRVGIPQSMLEEGENLVSFVAMGDEMDATLLDTIRLTYWHSYTADNDGLRFTAQGGEQLSIGGFGNSGIRVFDITEPTEVIEVIGKVESQRGGYAVSFRVPGTGERTLLALTDEKAKNPVEVVSNYPSTWHEERSGYDLVIICHRDFMDSLQPLKKLRESQGLRVALIDIEDLYDEFSFGNKGPKAIKDFLSLAKANCRKAPRFVLLVGDASFDPRNYLSLGDMDYVPTKLIDTVYMETASDDWFVDLNNDGLPDIAIGRLPVQTPGEATLVVSKIVGYEKSSKKSEALLVADINDGFDFEGASEEIRGLLPSSLMVRKIYRGEFSSDAQAKAELLNGINQGVLLVNFIGHGSVEHWRGSLLTLEDAENLINGLRLPFFVNMTCLNGFFQNPYGETLAEALIKAAGGGTIAIWTSSGLTEPDKQAVMNKELIKVLFGREALTLGEATARAKASVSDQDIRKTWILFGDPTTRLK